MAQTWTLTGGIADMVGGLEVEALTGFVVSSEAGLVDPDTGELRVGSWKIPDFDQSNEWSVPGLPDTDEWGAGHQLQLRAKFWDPASKQVITYTSSWFDLTSNLNLKDVPPGLPVQISKQTYDSLIEARDEAVAAAAAAVAVGASADAQTASNVNSGPLTQAALAASYARQGAQGRTDLGLGTAATHAHGDYDLSGAATSAQAAAIADALAKYRRPLGNSVAYMGDSTGVGGNTPVIPDIDFGDGTRIPTSDGYVGVGHTLNNVGTMQRGESPLSYASLLAGGRIFYGINASVAGELVTQMETRFAADVVARAPQVAVFGGGINDIGQSAAGTAAAAFLAWKNAIKSMVAQSRAAGIIPILYNVLPNNNALSGQDRKALISKYNAWLTRYALSERITLLDYHAAMVDTSSAGGGGLATAYNGGDGTHPNSAGYFVLGTLLANALAAILPQRAPLLCWNNTDANSMLTNPLFALDTNADGLADSWSQFNAALGATYAISTPTDSALPGKVTRLTMSGAAASQYGVTENITVASGKVSVADRLLLSGYVTNSGLADVDVQVTFTGATTVTTKFMVVRISRDITRGLFVAEMIVPPGTTAVALGLFNRGGTGYCEFGQLSFYNLTKLGIETL